MNVKLYLFSFDCKLVLIFWINSLLKKQFAVEGAPLGGCEESRLFHFAPLNFMSPSARRLPQLSHLDSISLKCPFGALITTLWSFLNFTRVTCIYEDFFMHYAFLFWYNKSIFLVRNLTKIYLHKQLKIKILMNRQPLSYFSATVVYEECRVHLVLSFIISYSRRV